MTMHVVSMLPEHTAQQSIYMSSRYGSISLPRSSSFSSFSPHSPLNPTDFVDLIGINKEVRSGWLLLGILKWVHLVDSRSAKSVSICNNHKIKGDILIRGISSESDIERFQEFVHSSQQTFWFPSIRFNGGCTLEYNDSVSEICSHDLTSAHDP
jgi:hypothetical protein